MKQRFVGLAAALALCCTVSGAMLERAVCCPAPPGLAHIEKQFQTMVGMEKGDGNWLYSYQMLSAPKYAVCATAVRTGGSGRRESVRVLWRLENGVWRLNGKTDVFPGLILPQAVSRSGVCTAWRMRMGNSEEYLDAAAMGCQKPKTPPGPVVVPEAFCVG